MVHEFSFTVDLLVQLGIDKAGGLLLPELS